MTVVRARWQRLNTVIDGVRYYEIQTIIRSVGASQNRQMADDGLSDLPIMIDCKVVHRRYSDFEILHKELIDQYLNRFIPAIPSKSIQDRISNDDSTFVVERTKQLQAFLDALLADVELNKSGIILKFLSFSER